MFPSDMLSVALGLLFLLLTPLLNVCGPMLFARRSRKPADVEVLPTSRRPSPTPRAATAA